MTDTNTPPNGTTPDSTPKDGKKGVKASEQYKGWQAVPYDEILESHKRNIETAGQNGSITIIEPGTKQHIAETDARQTISREKRYAALKKHAQENGGEINGVKFDTLKESIEALNASGRAVLCKVGGVNYLFQPKEQEKVAENQAAVAQAQQEEETPLWKTILKWTGILALIGLATFGLYKLFRKWNGDDEKTIVKYQNDPTTAPTPTTTINSLQPPTNVQTQTNSTTGNGVLGSGLGTPVTDATFPTVTNNALGSNSNSNGL
ncbi:MAG: hypothetical protein IJY58_02310 [Alphaproteobacteria bacterium]|nr:hypothetical protein [Alphaproteobacteria bacterium]